MPSPLRWPCLLPALATSGLLWLCYFPAAWGWLAWVALVPFLCLVRSDARPRRVYGAAWLGAVAFFLPALQWLRVADPRMYITWLLLTLHCSFFILAALVLLRRLDRRTPLPLVVTLPVVWTAIEFLRAYVLTGFPWYYLAHTQHDFLPLIQFADVTGAYGVTFLVAAVNAVLFELLCARHWFRALCALPEHAGALSRRVPLSAQIAVIVFLFGACLVYGFIRLGQEDFTPGPRVALIQGNLEQGIRNDASVAGGNPAQTMVRHFEKLHQQAVAQTPRPDLIVWPETSYLDDWIDFTPDYPAESLRPEWQRARINGEVVTVAHLPDWRGYLRSELNREALRVGPESATHVLLGLNTQVYGAEPRTRRYNSAVLIRPTLQERFAGRYDKIHRVPFGEFVPLRESLPFMNTFAPYDFDYSISAGEALTRFALGDWRFGVLICYEDTDPDLARQYVTPGGEPAVDFLVNISNDGWFNGTSEHEEHLAICRFRAIEARRPIVRSVNMGISAVIDGSGRVVNLPGPSWADSKKVEAVLTATVPLDRRGSLYAAWGDWLPWSCWALLGVGVVGSLLRRKQV